MLRHVLAHGSSIGSALALAALLIAACGNFSAAPVDVEGTVQARVTASVGAITRAQPTATLRPGTPAVSTGFPTASPQRTASGTAGSTVAGTTTSTAAGTAAAGTPSATRPATTPSPLAGTAVATSSPLAGGTAAATVAGTAAAPLTLGSYARLGSISVTVAHYEWSSICATGGRVNPGTKMVTLQAASRNDGSAAQNLPSLQWSLAGAAPSGGTLPCQPEGQSFASACYGTGPLAPGARCDGWLVFEVPESLDVPGAVVQARAAGVTPDAASWRLPTA